MGPLRAQLVLLLVFFGVASGETRRALLVGINTYTPPEGEKSLARRGLRNLGGAVNDVHAMRETLTSRFGFLPANIEVLEDRKATRGAILQALRTQLVPPDARPGDVGFFFYAGHGSQVLNSKSRESDHLDESLVPADSYQGVPDIRDKELARLFNDILDRGIRLTVIVDSCHSGSIARSGPSRSRALEADPQDANDPGDLVRKSPQERGALILSSAQESQEALEMPDRQHGAFTWALTRVLSREPPEKDVVEIFQEVRALMQSQASGQEPVLAGANRSRLTLLGGRAANESSSDSMTLKGPMAGGHVLLEGGLAAGLSEGCELARQGRSVRVVKVLSVTQVEAEPTEGNLDDLEPGALFQLTRWVTPAEVGLRVFVPGGLGIRFGLEQAGAAVRTVDSMAANPQYQVERRLRAGNAEYRLTSLGVHDAREALPSETDWVSGPDAAKKLEQFAKSIQRIRAWLQLVSPPGRAFPYRLGFRNAHTGEVKAEGDLREGDEYRLVLTREGPALEHVGARYIYVFSVDSNGRSTLLFPLASSGTDGNRLPVEGAPEILALGQDEDSFQITPPFGVDTCVLLTTVKPLPHPGILEFDGVHTTAVRGELDPLEKLLSDVGGETERGPAPAPTKWSVQKSIFRTVRK